MPYPSNYNNNAPYNAGPVNNVNLLLELRNRLARHNVIPVTRIINRTDIVFNPYTTPIDWKVGNATGMQNFVYGITPNSGSALALTDGDIVAFVGRTNPAQNGIFKYVQGVVGAGYAKTLFTGLAAASTTGSTGPAFIRIQTLYSGSAFAPTYEVAASSETLAGNYLEYLWNPAQYFGVTGALAMGPSGREMLLDAAGVAYPQGFLATSGSPMDAASGVNNVGKTVYFAQADPITLGTTYLDFTTVMSYDFANPSSKATAGTERLQYNTDTLSQFFTTAKVMAQLCDNIAEFREAGGATNLTTAKKDYLVNLTQQQLMRLKAQMEGTLDDLYRLYYTMWNLDLMWFGTTGPRYPSEYGRGYQIYNTGNY